MFVCYRNISDADLKFIQTMENLEECMINGKIYLTDRNTLKMLSDIENIDKKDKNRIRVKNGFATLNDKFFIIDDYSNKEDKNIITVYKASNGEMHYFFYPYNKDGKPMSLLEMDDKLVEFMRNKAIEMEIDTENPAWYLYGRTQALNDVKYNKISVNNLIRNSDDIKLYFLINNNKEQFGVYSGYYIPVYESYNGNFMSILRTIKTQDFVNYIKAVGKYKNCGYYTFSSKELEAWLNYQKEKLK